MANLFKKIDPNLIADEEFDLEDLEEELRNQLEDSGILEQGTFYMGSSNGKFDDNTWIVENELKQQFFYFKFHELDKLKFKGLKENSKRLIKCWVAHMLTDGYGAKGLQGNYNHLVRFIELTHNFDENYVNREEGIKLKTLLGTYEYNVDDLVFGVVSYIDYVIQFNLERDGVNLQKYSWYLNLMLSWERRNSIRKLPRNIDIIKLDYYIKRFFKEERDKELKLYFMPVLLWWKITNVIPMRPSELCFKLKRNCLIPKNGVFYLKIGRVKQNKIKRKYKLKPKLPILDEIEISQEIYNLINDYIEETDGYGVTETLISYRACKAARDKIMQKQIGRYDCIRNYGCSKYNLNAFSSTILDTIIKNFYNAIIKEKYKDNDIKDQVKMNDTRHFAFTSLMIQGVDPVRIAMLGGHTTLQSQNFYESNVSYYVDSEMVNLVNLNQIRNTKPLKTIKEIVFNQMQNCPKSLNECLETEEGIGYCTCDFENEMVTCEDERYCFFCSKWWCEPAEDNYIKLVKFIEESVIPLEEEQIKEEEAFLNNLIINFKVENIDGILAINKDDKEEYERKRLDLKSNVDNLIEIKASLLNAFGKSAIKGDRNGES